MLYSILKTIIETTIHQYNCQNCQGKIHENSITVREVGERRITLDIICPHCASQAQIHAEVANIPAENHVIQKSPIIPKNTNAISEADIKNIESCLKNTQTLEDLLT